MSLQTRLSALITAIGADIKAINSRLAQPATAVARAYRSAGGAPQISGGAWTLVAYDADTAPGFDPGNHFSTVTHLYTCPVTGYYLVDAAVSANSASAGTGGLNLSINHNGGAVAQGAADVRPLLNTQLLNIIVCDVVYCVAGDTLGIFGYGQGVAFNINAGAAITYMSVALLAT